MKGPQVKDPDRIQRTALITGGVRGIGRAIGLELARQGWSVAACYRTSEADAASFREEAERLGGTAWTGAFDVSTAQACFALVDAVEADLGPVDVLVHAAGPYHRVPLLEETDAAWRAMFDANLHALFTLAKRVQPGMCERGWGRILAFSMANADRMVAQPAVTAHYIAKSSVLILVRTLAKLLAPHGVTVNAISPGFIDSGSAPSEELAGMAPKIPAGYIGELKDAVSAARFLLSEEARYVNGANLHLSGGWGI